jgi:hypothetical protein
MLSLFLPCPGATENTQHTSPPLGNEPLGEPRDFVHKRTFPSPHLQEGIGEKTDTFDAATPVIPDGGPQLAVSIRRAKEGKFGDTVQNRKITPIIGAKNTFNPLKIGLQKHSPGPNVRAKNWKEYNATLDSVQTRNATAHTVQTRKATPATAVSATAETVHKVIPTDIIQPNNLGKQSTTLSADESQTRATAHTVQTREVTLATTLRTRALSPYNRNRNGSLVHLCSPYTDGSLAETVHKVIPTNIIQPNNLGGQSTTLSADESAVPTAETVHKVIPIDIIQPNNLGGQSTTLSADSSDSVGVFTTLTDTDCKRLTWIQKMYKDSGGQLYHKIYDQLVKHFSNRVDFEPQQFPLLIDALLAEELSAETLKTLYIIRGLFHDNKICNLKVEKLLEKLGNSKSAIKILYDDLDENKDDCCSGFEDCNCPKQIPQLPSLDDNDEDKLCVNCKHTH